MSALILSFDEIAKEQQAAAGGKGGALARLYQAGYPVPDGFVILPSAFARDKLTPAAWGQVRARVQQMRNGDGRIAFAVRSSALSEDSAQASFAGEFETVLDVHTDEMLGEAIHTVRRSRKSARVIAYSEAKGMDSDHEIAVVVQRLVRADISGILFTADPVTGSRQFMTGNFIYGLGEDLVSGEAEPFTFNLKRPKGVYEGAPALNRFAKKLFQLGAKLEKELGCPQDIEWAIADGKLYLLQSRPITTLTEYDPATGMWNSSHAGDYVWMGNEVFPDVMTPGTFSMWQTFHNFQIAGARTVGNIGGRFYMNFSMAFTLMQAFGKSMEDTLDYIELAGGAIPEGAEIPVLPVSRLGLIKEMLPVQFQLLPRQFRLKRQADAIIDSIPTRCQKLREHIREITKGKMLIVLWQEEILPLFKDLILIQDGLNEDYFNPFLALKKELAGLLGQIEAKRILSTIGGNSGNLASLGSLMGLARLKKGEISRAEYAQIAGHRPNRENELLVPRPYEDPDWLDKQLQEFEKNPVDISAMQEKRAREFAMIWRDFAQAHPKKARSMLKKIQTINKAIEKRELIRSELTRMIGVVRDWFLRASEMLELGDDVFFLTYQEVSQALMGDKSAVAYIPARKETYEKLCALPPYPVVISGRFDPFQWAADPERRSDVFDSHTTVPFSDSDIVTGYPGSSGRVEGIIRFLTGPEEGEQLQKGEILLASTTNVGWTPIFPRAKAVITDIGAPLSHAAIVARELGIPAVIGCGNATMRLRSGDRVVVDGGRGTVEVLDHA
jgi:phosphohistidine swiveling domain-containing protein